MLVFETARTNLWKSDEPVLTALVLWKEGTLFVKNRSTWLGLKYF